MTRAQKKLFAKAKTRMNGILTSWRGRYMPAARSKFETRPIIKAGETRNEDNGRLERTDEKCRII